MKAEGPSKTFRLPQSYRAGKLSESLCLGSMPNYSRTYTVGLAGPIQHLLLIKQPPSSKY